MKSQVSPDGEERDERWQADRKTNEVVAFFFSSGEDGFELFLREDTSWTDRARLWTGCEIRGRTSDGRESEGELTRGLTSRVRAR